MSRYIRIGLDASPAPVTDMGLDQTAKVRAVAGVTMVPSALTGTAQFPGLQGSEFASAYAALLYTAIWEARGVGGGLPSGDDR
jgi:hypothetical protein